MLACGGSTGQGQAGLSVSLDMGHKVPVTPCSPLEVSLCLAALCATKLKQPFVSLSEGAYHPFW